MSANLVKNFFSEPGCSLVLVGNTLDCSHGLILATTRNKELRRLVEGEQEESAQEHAECNGTQGQNKISPTPVIGLVTCGIVRAREIRNKSPGKHTSNQGTNRPPGSETTQNIGGVRRQTLEEDSCVDRQISTNTQTQACVQSADPKFKLVAIPLVIQSGKITYATQLFPPPAARPKVPQMKSVQLKAGRRPMASEAIPQNEAPTIRPTKRETVANRE